jgi:hypothetical protein
MANHFNITSVTALEAPSGFERYNVMVTFNLDSGTVTGNALGYVFTIPVGGGKAALEAELEACWAQENGYDLAKVVTPTDIASMVPQVTVP